MKTPGLLAGAFVAPAFIIATLVAFPGRIHGQPVNDMFANRTVLAGAATSASGSNIGASSETGEPVHAGVGGGCSVWWTWTAPRAGTVTISTAGSSFDTVLGVYSGSSVAGLTKLDSNDDDAAAGVRTSKVVIDVSSGQVCQIAVDGWAGDTGSIRLSIQLGALVPPKQAAAWVLPDPYGQTVYSSSFAGKVIILDFWATWCGPCKAEMPDFVALQEKYRDDGLVIVGADTGWSGDTASVVRSFLATFTPTINYQIVMATTAMMNSYGTIDAIPRTFIIDRQNYIRGDFLGTQSGTIFEEKIIPLLYRNMGLCCAHGAGEMSLSWPVTAQPFNLESTTDLINPVWSAWATPPVVVNGTNTVTVPATGSPRYFRLRMRY